MRPNVLAVALAGLVCLLPSIALAQFGGGGGGATGMTTSGSNATAAALGNITTTATGCNVTTKFVRADGTCQTAGGSPTVYVGAVAGSANTYTITSPIPASPAYTLVDQYVVRTIINATNTNTSTLNVNSTGALPIVANSVTGLVALVAGELLAGVEYDFTASSASGGACGGAGPGTTPTCYVMSWLPQSAVQAGMTQTVSTSQWAAVTAYNVTTANQTLTLPASTGLNGNGAIFVTTNANSVTIAPTAASGDSIANGTTAGAANASFVLAPGNLAFVTISGSHQFTVATASTGIPASATNDNALAGNLGQVVSAACTLASQTATFVNTSANITMATTAIPVGCPVNFTTTGTLPTNFATATQYFVLTSNSGTKIITVSATPTGAAISAGSAGTGTQTAVNTFLMSTGVAKSWAALSLPAGNWNCWGNIIITEGSTSTIISGSINQAINTVSVTDPSYFSSAASYTTAVTEAWIYGLTPQNVASTTEVYWNINHTFAGTDSAQGNVSCQRPR